MAATTASTNAVWSFGLGGMEEEEEEESQDFMCQKVVEQEPTEETLETSEGSLDMEAAANKPSPAAAVWSFGLGGQEQDADEDDDEEEDAWGAAVAPATTTTTTTTTSDVVAQEEEEETPSLEEESMEFVPISSQVAPASPAAFAINEDEEVTDEGAFLSPVTPPKKSINNMLGRRPQTVGGALNRPHYAFGRERMTPGSLLSKMTPKSTFKRASDIAAFSVNKKSEDKISRAERLMAVQSSFRHLDLNDSSSSLPMMALPDLNASQRIDESEEQEEEEEEESERRDSDSSAILPSLPMNSTDDWESSRRTITESSDPSAEFGVVMAPPPPPLEEESPATTTKKKKKSSKSKSPRLNSRKTKKLDDEASTSTKKKKKKGLKKAIKMATAPAVAMTELVRDTSNGMTEMVKSAAEGVSTRTSELGDIIKDKKKKKKNKDSDDATATSKKKKKPKASKSLSPVPAVMRKKKKSKSKLVDGRKGLPTATERPMDKQDSFSSNHSAQSCQSFS